MAASSQGQFINHLSQTTILGTMRSSATILLIVVVACAGDFSPKVLPCDDQTCSGQASVWSAMTTAPSGPRGSVVGYPLAGASSWSWATCWMRL